MRVAHIVEASLGGLGRHVLDIFENIDRARFELALYYSPLRADRNFIAGISALERRGLRCCPVDMPRRISPMADAGAIRRLRHMLLKDGPWDVLHGHSSKGGAYARILSRVLPESPTAIYTPNAFAHLNLHAAFVERVAYRLLERMLAPLADIFIGVSPSELDEAERLRIGRRRHLIPNGVREVDRGRATRLKSDMRCELGIPEGGFVVGSVGRLTDQKAPERFAGVARELTAATDHIFTLWIGDGELRDSFLSLYAPDSRRRFFLGYREDARKLVGGFDLCALFSRYEGMPYAMLEAMSLGVPTVGTNVPGIKDVLEEGVGFGVPEWEPETAVQLIRSLANQPEKVSQLGDAAMAHAKARFSLRQSVRQLEAVYSHGVIEIHS